jgi:hypothetical protein
LDPFCFLSFCSESTVTIIDDNNHDGDKSNHIPFKTKNTIHKIHNMINPELFLNLPDFFIRDSILSFLPTKSLLTRLVIAIGKAPSSSSGGGKNSHTIRRLLAVTKESLLVRSEKILAQLEGMQEDLLVEFLQKHFTGLADTGRTTFFETAQQCCVILAYTEHAIKNRLQG